MYLPHLRHAGEPLRTQPEPTRPGLRPRTVPPPKPQRAGLMYWLNYSAVYVDRLRARYRSDYPEQVRRILDRFTTVCRLESVRLTDIDEMTLETYLSARRRATYRGKPLSSRTLNNEINTINAALAAAGPRGPGSARNHFNLITSPPWLPPLPELYGEPNVVTVEQISAALNACNAARTPRVAGVEPAAFWRAALLLDLVTLLRRRALLRIPRPDDDTLLGKLEIVLPAELNKTGRTIRLSLGSIEVANIVAAMPTRPGEPLLPWFRELADGVRRPMSLAYFSHQLAGLQRAAGIDDAHRLRLKDLRSTGGTLVADIFGDAVAKKQLGHAPNTDTIQRHYKSYRPTDANQRASATLAGLILPQITAAQTADRLRLHDPESA